MIIKVPIYVELTSIQPEDVATIVEVMAKKFYITLRMKDFENFKKTLASEIGAKNSVEFKLLSKVRALDHLRTGK